VVSPVVASVELAAAVVSVDAAVVVAAEAAVVAGAEVVLLELLLPHAAAISDRPTARATTDALRFLVLTWWSSCWERREV
jgi:hypothetical protein